MNETERALATLQDLFDNTPRIDFALEIAIEALREQAERSEHCRGWDSRCEASYCPMCGRR